MLICAQSGRVSGLVKKTDPTSSSRSEKKGLKDNNNRLMGIVKSLVSLLVQKVTRKGKANETRKPLSSTN